MASSITSFESQHQDMVHDAQPDYYGKRLATCSSDQTVKIFDLGTKQLIADLVGHAGPVWQVSWAHPKFGTVLATCGFDRKVIIWKEQDGHFTALFEYARHESSVNSVAWAPHEYGLMFACASSDNRVSVVSRREDDTWHEEMFMAHQMGCNAVSWAPFLKPGATIGTADVQQGYGYGLRLVTGGCDSAVKIWAKDGESWKEEHTLKGHTDWVRDVAWAPNMGLPASTIASCSQDRFCLIWTQDLETKQWKSTPLPEFAAPVWRVSWSLTGNMLAVSTGDNRVTLWREQSDGKWVPLSAITESGIADP